VIDTLSLLFGKSSELRNNDGEKLKLNLEALSPYVVSVIMSSLSSSSVFFLASPSPAPASAVTASSSEGEGALLT
jgi:hypothetical protein